MLAEDLSAQGREFNPEIVTYFKYFDLQAGLEDANLSTVESVDRLGEFFVFTRKARGP